MSEPTLLGSRLKRLRPYALVAGGLMLSAFMLLLGALISIDSVAAHCTMVSENVQQCSDETSAWSSATMPLVIAGAFCIATSMVIGFRGLNAVMQAIGEASTT